MKILYVTTISNTVNAFLIPHIKMLAEHGFQVDCAFKVEQKVKDDLYNYCKNVYDIPFSRNPFNLINIFAYQKLKNIISEQEYDLIHTHTPVASAITRLICLNNSKSKVVYTAHGFHFYKGAPLINWLFYYPLEYYLSRSTKAIITMNEEDFERSQKFNSKYKFKISGVGLDLNKFPKDFDTVEFRSSLGFSKDDFILVSVGELSRRKNHIKVVKLIEKMKDLNLKYVIVGTGKLYAKLQKEIEKNHLEDNIKLLGYRNDVSKILLTSNLFVFPSLHEGLPVSLMEAIASSLPVVCSNIRGNKDLVINSSIGICVNNDEEYEKAIRNYYSKQIQKSSSFDFKFELSNVLNELWGIYKDVINDL